MFMGVEELLAPLESLPPVDFCCVYGSSLLPNNTDKAAIVDYILGVSDPVKWHSENLARNRGHYASWMACLGPEAIVRVAQTVGVGVHFNPFVPWKNKMIKYGVVGMQDLVLDVLTWNKFYLGGRLQKPVCVLVDKFGITKVNAINLKSAVAAGLLLSPPEFTEVDLYSTICSLSYMGDLRMFFAEDKHKIKKIVNGSIGLFQNIYRPYIREYSMEGLLEASNYGAQKSFKQDYGLSATRSLFYSLPLSQSQPRSWIGSNAGSGTTHPVSIACRKEAVAYIRKALRRRVMVSSVKQALSGFLAAGGVNSVYYLGNKMAKAWKSRTTSP